MMKRMFLFIVLALFALCIVEGQNEGFFRLSWEKLPQNYDSKKQRVDNLLSKSAFYFQKAGKAENELRNYQESEKNNPIRQLALKERVYRLYLKAYSYVEDAHRIQFKILEKSLENSSLSGNEEMKVELEKQFRSGSVLRRKGGGVVPRVNPRSLLAEATELESEVLETMEKLLIGETIAMDSPSKLKDSAHLTIGIDKADEDFVNKIDTMSVVMRDSVEDQTVSTISAMREIEEKEENTPLVKPEQDNVVEAPETDVSTQKTKEVFYSIQFLAVREEVSEAQVEKIYNGALPVIENFSDGWYRFSAGEFDTVSEALSEMKRQGIHGFVVAFHGNDRISISKAKNLK